MPWKERSVMDERVKFVARLLDGESMTSLCREFGISRKTGYKIVERYQDIGTGAFTDRSRRPIRLANQLPLQVEKFILNMKKEYPSWGARKIREKLIRKFPDVRTPAKSTIHAALDRNGLVIPRGRIRRRAEGTVLSQASYPNELWCADYKGEFMLGSKEYCYPLTITDQASRYLLRCEGLSTTKEIYAFTVFEKTFKEYGLPKSIRTDNGVPFASANSLFNLSKLSVWWLRLGIQIERIQPGCPQQNGRHERMHLTLKKEATKPAGQNFLQQQAKFDDFLEEFNTDRPHEALGMKYPSEIYTRSDRSYQGLQPIEYPLHDREIEVTSCGRICIGKMKINLSKVFMGQKLGLKEVGDGTWLVTFMDYDLGYFDTDSCRFEPLANPFGPKVLPMS
ncbi:MAG: integrase [Bdellovibrionales bacterium CG10_big_fil_rev_8_21_14_0_10_45_34]|nr:MAG: integrase [Bdellovibrionales bacterium CG10_big_fil_rev_8_21_14_0_10_45_34]